MCPTTLLVLFMGPTVLFQLRDGNFAPPCPAWLAPPYFALRGFSPSRKGGGAGMGWDFNPAPQGEAGKGLDF